MSACQDRKVTKDIWLSWLVCILTCTPIFVVRYPRLMGLPQIRIYDTSKMGFKLVQTIEAQVNTHILSYLILSPHIASYLTISYHQDVGWSVLDVALSPDGGHLVYSSWSDSLHQVPVTMISFSDQNYHHPTRDDLILTKMITRPNGQSQYQIFYTDDEDRNGAENIWMIWWFWLGDYEYLLMKLWFSQNANVKWMVLSFALSWFQTLDGENISLVCVLVLDWKREHWTNTNTQIQIQKCKCKYTNANTQIQI